MKYKILILICVCLTLAGAAGSLLVLNAPAKQRVNIISDGKIVRTLDLSEQKDVVFDVNYSGRTNTVEVKNGQLTDRFPGFMTHVFTNAADLSAPVDIAALEAEIRETDEKALKDAVSQPRKPAVKKKKVKAGKRK